MMNYKNRPVLNVEQAYQIQLSETLIRLGPGAHIRPKLPEFVGDPVMFPGRETEDWLYFQPQNAQDGWSGCDCESGASESNVNNLL